MVDHRGDLSVEMSNKLERVQWITIIKNDMNTNILTPLVDIFTQLEIEGSLNIANETDLFCLHFVYLPRINKLLHDFACCYNACCIPRGNGATPSQIFYAHNEHVNANSKDILPSLISKEENCPDICLLDVSPIPADKFQELKEHVDPLEECADGGKNLYFNTGRFVTRCLKAVMDANAESNASDPGLAKENICIESPTQYPGEEIQVILEETTSGNSVVVVESGNSLEENILAKLQEASKSLEGDSMEEKSTQEIIESLMSQAASELKDQDTSIDLRSSNRNYLTEINGQQVVILDSSKEGDGDSVSKTFVNLDPASLVILNSAELDNSDIELQIATQEPQSSEALESDIITIAEDQVSAALVASNVQPVKNVL